MKRLLSVLLILVVLLSSVYYAAAEDLSAMSEDDLLALRLAINNELAARYEPPVFDGKTVIDIFPDKPFAIYMRDAMGAFSINDEVSQEMLESVTDIFINDMDMGLSSMEGIQYLTNLKYITCVHQRALTQLPEIGNLQQLYSIDFAQCGLTSLPESICSCMAMKTIDVYGNPITALPEDIGNLTSLNSLDISYTQITSLPESIRNLKLKEFNRKGLNLGE